MPAQYLHNTCTIPAQYRLGAVQAPSVRATFIPSRHVHHASTPLTAVPQGHIVTVGEMAPSPDPANIALGGNETPKGGGAERGGREG